jgi:hypothetical protein
VELAIIEAIARKGGAARLLGGRAVAYLCGDAIPDRLRRESADIDLFVLKRDRKLLTQTLVEMGCAAEVEFNILNGRERLMFHRDAVKIDVFVDTFRMCHVLDLRPRIAHARVTLPAADLLLTKLQVVDIDAKDLIDMAALLVALPIDAEDRKGIDATYLASRLAADWGLWRTSTRNLESLRASQREILPDDGAWSERLLEAIDTVEAAIDHAPKSIAWRARSILGERIAWYERPEEPEVRPMPTRGPTLTSA